MLTGLHSGFAFQDRPPFVGVTEFYRQTILAEPALMGYWRLGESSGDFIDISAENNTATVSGGVTQDVTGLVASSSDKAATFDGSDDKAVLASSSLFDWERTQSWTVEFFIKPNFPRSGASEKIPIFSKLESSGDLRGFEVYVEYRSSSGKTRIGAVVANNYSTTKAEASSRDLDLANDQVFHCVITYTGGGTASSANSFFFWINGTQDFVQQLGGNCSTTILSSVAPSIGGRADDGLFGVGTIDEISVYDEVLTPNKIVEHYVAGIVGNYAPLAQQSNPKIIFDTDLNTDCDDAGALAIVHAMQNLGECEIIACGTSVSNPDVVNAIDAINTWYGRGDIPIGRWTGTSLQPTGDAWVTDLKNDFPNDIGDGSLAPAAVDVYRQALADAADGSVIIIQVGFSTNTAALLNSAADGISSLTGAQLIAAKVTKLVIMGGKYWRTGLSASHNFVNDPARAEDVAENWPGPIFYLGSEQGDSTNSGNTLDDNTPIENPVRYAYEGNGSINGRNSWDLLAALYAIRGARPEGVPLYREIPGTNDINGSSGVNTWTPGVGGPHYRLLQIRIYWDMQAYLNGLLDAPSLVEAPLVSQGKMMPSDYREIATADSRITWQSNSSPVGQLVACAIDNAQFYIINSYGNYGGGFTTGELPGRETEAAVTCRASYYASSGGSMVPLTFAGLDEVVIPFGQGVRTDPLTTQLPASGWYVRIEFVTSEDDQIVPLFTGYDSPQAGVLDDDVVYQSAFSLTDDNGGSPRIHRPVAVFGTPVSPPDAKYLTNSFSGVGDSITSAGGTLETVLNDADLAFCWIAQAGHGVYHYTARPTEYMSSMKDLVFGSPQLVFAWGVNDVRDGRTSSQLIADVQDFAADYAAAGGQRILLCTLTPLTSSTDAWATVGNQTELFGGNREAYNTWVLAATSEDLSGLEVMVIDIADASSEPGTEKWPAGWTDDGVHPNGTGYSAIRTALTSGVITQLKTDF